MGEWPERSSNHMMQSKVLPDGDILLITLYADKYYDVWGKKPLFGVISWLKERSMGCQEVALVGCFTGQTLSKAS